MSNSNSQGRIAVVTGASSGIGEATARALAADGYRLALLARRLDRITALADELGNGSIAIQADVTDRDSIVAAAERVRQELGGTDVLVNNAGIMLLGPFDSNQRDDYRQMIDVNLLGAITATEIFLDQLKDGGGDIINISSVAGRTAHAGNGVYAATKWGLNGWTESLRQELLPTSGSRSSSPASSPLSCRTTSPTRKRGRASSSSTARPRSLQTTSPRSLPSPSAVRAASPSTKCCYDPRGNNSDAALLYCEKAAGAARLRRAHPTKGRTACRRRPVSTRRNAL
jgi:NADP-dependent 3-hydroxy acid dehydrogenase YdfG